ncbi:hypothetical protein [Lysinibacillus sp.]|uniref:hypothetical protein n=1 Tax=Lysinibacillus sp. TaxID=1869345 RepID=UPI00289A3E9E|nr:hypothetical protein [Lysinibacillus sp.]
MTNTTSTFTESPNVLLVEGATPFVDAFTTNFKSTINPTKYSLIKCEQPGEVCTAKVIFDKTFSTSTGVIMNILKSIVSVIVDNHTDLSGKNTVVHYAHFTFTFTPNVVDAIRQQAEITYVVKCKLVKHLKPKNIVKAENLVEYFHDTCFTYFEGKTLVADKYYFSNLKQPLPVEEMVQVCTGTEYILKQFSQVKELKCIVRATGIVRE